MPISIIYDVGGRIVGAAKLSEGRQGMVMGGEGQNVVIVDSDVDLDTLVDGYSIDVERAALVRRDDQAGNA